MENTNCIISENIKNFRKKSSLTQEDLAQKLGVTFRAVSKWENGQSAPDIMFLPELAEIFGCTIDELFSRKVEKNQNSDACAEFPWQDDDVVRGVVCVGRKILQVQNDITNKIVFEIKGDTKSVHSVCSINICGNVSGGCNAGDGINIEGSLAGGCNCGDGISVGGDLFGGCNCGDSINVGRDLNGGINCGGNVKVGGNVDAEKIKGDVECRDLRCDLIEGNVVCSSVECKHIDGNVTVNN